jgi:hypothetical protein
MRLMVSVVVIAARVRPGLPTRLGMTPVMMTSRHTNEYKTQNKQVFPKHVRLPKARTAVREAASRFRIQAIDRVTSSIDISVVRL